MRQFFKSTNTTKGQFFSTVTENNGVSIFTKKTIEVPTWGMFTLGAAGMGFFGKILHDDNLATRQELGAVRQEMKDNVKDLRQEIGSLRQEMKDNVKDLREEMKSNTKELKELIIANQKPRAGWW